IPAEMRKLFGIKVGGDVTFSVEDGNIKISTHDAALRRLQQMADRIKRPGVSIVDEFIAERRKEAENE
ncbi:MAG TPA: AbrB/MazE/SpoVT family DNA-binding domain-containing protein, partial [Pyrinomonadaceae bacterium]|nr:AbrB/MazE/SpoVT family DNA-binding domain-containing protein [Pyrinomonadaceae bacterium]